MRKGAYPHMVEVFGEQQNAHVMLHHAIEKGQVSHAYLFTGTGLQQEADRFAKAVVCERKQYPGCGICLGCRKFDAGNHPDVIHIRPDGTSVKIDQIRALQRAVSYRSMDANFKVYIIHQAEELTLVAANGLLKFLEEPENPTVAILLAHQLDKILPTIKSRCQVVHFRPKIEVSQRVGRWTKVVAYLGNAGIYHDHTVAQDEETFAEVVDKVLQLSDEIVHDNGDSLLTINEQIVKPSWPTDKVILFVSCLACWFRDVLFVQNGMEDRILYEDCLDQLRIQGRQSSSERLEILIETSMNAIRRLQAHANPQLTLESMVLKLKEVY